MMPEPWFPDSGATHHITSDFSNLFQSHSYGGSSQVHMGNGQGLTINSIGSSTFPSFHPHVSLSLNDLLHVPSITKNLMSVSKFARDNKVFFEFHSTTCFVKSQGSNVTLLEGSMDADGLYRFNNLPLVKKPSKSQVLSA